MAESTGPLGRGLAVLRVLSAPAHGDRAVRHSDLAVGPQTAGASTTRTDRP